MTEAQSPFVAAGQRARRDAISLLRASPVLFAEHILRNEKTQERIRLGPIQREWYSLMGKHDKLLLWSPPESGKTQLVVIAYAIWLLGNNHQVRIGILSNTHGQAEKSVIAIRDHIEKNAAVREVFPDLLPGDKWTDSVISIQRERSRTPSIQALGIGGSFTGDRIDVLLCDDILDYEVTRTKDRRDELWSWYIASVPDRLTARAKQVFIFNAWDEDDLPHRLARMPGWVWRQYPICDRDYKPTFLERFSPERIAELRTNNTVWEFARKFMCVLVNEDTARLKPSFIEIGKALARQHGLTLQHKLDVVPPGCATVTGVDLGIGRKKKHDQTALVTILRRLDGLIYPIGIEMGRWSGPDIRDKAIEHHERYHSILGVESIAAQAWMRDMIAEKRRDVPTLPFDTTGTRKEHPQFGIEAIGVRLQNGGIGLPEHPDLEPLLSDMVMYRPNSHTGDALMAFWIATEIMRAVIANADETSDVIIIGGRPQ